MKKLLVIAGIFLIQLMVFAASYQIDSLNILGELKRNGAMKVQEEITYDIGEINGILFNVDAKAFGGIRELSIYEDQYVDNKIQWKKIPEDKYEIYDDNGNYKIKLYSRNVNTVRKFLFVYTLPEAVTAYNDVAQLNRKMVGKNWQQPIKDVKVVVTLPVSKDFDNKDVLVFGHGPLTGEVDKDKNSVVYQVQDLQPGEFLEADILMPPSIFNEFPKNLVIHKDKKAEILQMEKNLADEANARRETAKLELLEYEKNRVKGKYVFGFEAVVGVLLFIYIRFFSYKDEKLDKNMYGEYLREPPDNYAPALVGTIFSKTPGKKEILATLLDLVRRKILKLEKIGDKHKLLVGNKERLKILTKQELVIYSIYIEEYGDGESVILEDIDSDYISRSGMKKFEYWQEEIDSELEDKEMVFGSIPLAKKGIFVFFIFGMFLSIGVQVSYFENEIFLLLIPIIFLILIATNSKMIESLELKKAKLRWGAFKNFLSDYSLLSEANIDAIVLWEQYFVYSVALGVSESVVRAYKNALQSGIIKDISGINTDFRNNITLFDLYLYDSAFSALSYSANSTVNSIARIASSRISSSSGFGGGFSGGSSGGGGGGSGGGAF